MRAMNYESDGWPEVLKRLAAGTKALNISPQRIQSKTITICVALRCQALVADFITDDDGMVIEWYGEEFS